MDHSMPTPNYVNPVSIGCRVTDVGIVTVVFAFVFVVVRLLTKTLVTRQVWVDDYFSILALCLAIGRTIIDVVASDRYGLGRHAWDVPDDWINGLVASFAVDSILYYFAILFAKLSILTLLYRIFKICSPFRYSAFVLGSIITLWCTVTSLISIFRCKPVAATYNFMLRMESNATCLSAGNILIAFGWFNIFSDLALLVLPMPLIWNLQLPWKKKIGVAVIFVTGAGICAITIVRQYHFYHNPEGYDWSYQNVPDKVWMTLETNLAIICGCLPVLQPLARKLPLLKSYPPTSLRSAFSGRSQTDNSKLSSSKGAAPDLELGERGRDSKKGFSAAGREVNSQDTDTSDRFASTVHLHGVPHRNCGIRVTDQVSIDSYGPA